MNKHMIAAKSNWIKAMLGILFSVFFFWLALYKTSWADVSEILRHIQRPWIVGAIAIYFLTMAVRVVRWRKLMWPIKPLSYRAVGIVLMVGYAMNNLLPARLGELFRADFTGRRHTMSRSAIIGSIALERTLDGLLIVFLLVIGSAFVQSHVILNNLVLGGSILFSGIFLCLIGLSRQSFLNRLVRLPEPVTRHLHSFQKGLSGLHLSLLFPSLLLTLLVWTGECISQWFILKAIGVTVPWTSTLSIIGVVSLSTLIPSAPGFAGTYQYAYAFIMDFLGYGTAEGVAAATAGQIFLLGSTSLVGIALYALVTVGTIGRGNRAPTEYSATVGVRSPDPRQNEGGR